MEWILDLICIIFGNKNKDINLLKKEEEILKKSIKNLKDEINELNNKKEQISKM